MEYEFLKFARKYDEQLNKITYKRDGRMSAFNPIIFLVIGDKMKNSLEYISDTINNKWENGNSFIYLYVSQEEIIEANNLLSFVVKYVNSSKEELRADIYNRFIEDKQQLVSLNRKIIEIKNIILAKSREFSFVERVNISVITRVDDPLNALVIPLTALFKSKLEEYFPIIEADLFDIMEEKFSDTDIGYNSAITMSYLMEIEKCQQRDFNYAETLDIHNEEINSTVEINNGKFFDLIYIISDRDELGFHVSNSEERNSKIISYLSLIKNLANTGSEGFNIISFKNAISIDMKKQSYVSAGLSEIRRPNKAIALVVLNKLYRDMVQKLKGLSKIDIESISVELGVDERSLEVKIMEHLTKGRKLEDMDSIMLAINDPRKAVARGISYHMAEKQLFADGCEDYFSINYIEKKNDLLKYNQIKEEMKILIDKKLIDKVQYGLYLALFITSEDGIIKDLKRIEKNFESSINNLSKRLDGYYNEIIRLSLLDKIFKRRAVKKIKKFIFTVIYSLKLDILSKDTGIEIISKYIKILRELNECIRIEISNLENLAEEIYKVADEETNYNQDYACENIQPYYENIVKSIEKELSEEKGVNFFFLSEFFGNISELVKKGSQDLQKRLIYICQNYVLNREQFNEPFESEMQKRANMLKSTVNSKILSKEEFFKNINNILEKDAKAHVYLVDYGNGVRIEEKYLFGKGDSEFMRYIDQYDKSIRNYKLGNIDTNLKSGIEKLNILGGFSIDNLFYFRNCEKYYNLYRKRGFKPSAIMNFSLKEE